MREKIKETHKVARAKENSNSNKLFEERKK